MWGYTMQHGNNDDVGEQGDLDDIDEKFAKKVYEEYYAPHMVFRSELTFHEFELLGAAFAEQTRDVDADNARWDAESPRRDHDEDTTGWAKNDRGVPDTGVTYDWLWSDTDKDISFLNAVMKRCIFCTVCFALFAYCVMILYLGRELFHESAVFRSRTHEADGRYQQLVSGLS